MQDSLQDKPPKAKEIISKQIIHGVELCDEYHWMRAENWQGVLAGTESLPEEINDHLKKELEYCNKMLSPSDEIAKQFYEEYLGRIEKKDEGVPSFHGEYSYFYRFCNEEDEYPTAMRIPSNQANTNDATVVLNIPELAKGLDFFSIGEFFPSPDNKLLLYSTDTTGAECYTIQIKEIDGGNQLNDVITHCMGKDLVWSLDNSGFYYITLNDNMRPDTIKYHRIGDNTENDLEILKSDDPKAFLTCFRSSDKKYVILQHHKHNESHNYTIPLDDNSNIKPQPFYREVNETQFNIDIYDDRAFIMTDMDGAQDFKIMSCKLEDHYDPTKWELIKDSIPQSQIDSFMVTKDYIAVINIKDASDELCFISKTDKSLKKIGFQEKICSLGFYGGTDSSSNTIRVKYSSLKCPTIIYDINLETSLKQFRKQTQIPSGFKPEQYVCDHLLAKADDGELVPITLLYHKDTKLDGNAGCFLYGYGAYGYCISPSFNGNILSLVDRGFVFAIAHIRGSVEKGKNWYESTRKKGKKLTFTDFISCAQHLIDNKITSKGKIIASGGSAGGLLMGAVVNMAPELFSGVLAHVPFVDTLNTMLDEKLPLTPAEQSEWGDPIRDKEIFEYIQSYSPYDNVKPNNYPTMLVTGGVQDPRVTYWEPAKWVARLRKNQQSKDNPIILKIDLTKGHFSAAARFQYMKEIAKEIAFLYWDFIQRHQQSQDKIEK